MSQRQAQPRAAKRPTTLLRREPCAVERREARGAARGRLAQQRRPNRGVLRRAAGRSRANSGNSETPG
jgi:hypothetical protein